MVYRRRIVDDTLDELFPHLAAIALEGAKGVGKTATAKQRAATILALDRERQLETLGADPDAINRMPAPVLIDEWQLLPPVWDSVRRSVDDDAAGGRFLLTGSAGVAPGTRIHSGAGRIVSLRMHPLSVAERDIERPTVSLRELLDGGADIGGRTDVRLADYTDEILRSGLPGIRNLPEQARRAQLDGYIERLVTHELPENGVEVRRPLALRSWLAAYAAATSTDASYSLLLNAATAGLAEKPTRQTLDGYREQLHRLFIVDPVQAWSPTFAPLRRLTKAPKHHLVDPALAARLVGVGRAGLLQGEGDRPSNIGGTWLGALFESLVTQSVRVYATAAHANLGHLRTYNSDREIDLIVEGDGFKVVAIEVKLAGTVGDHDVRHLNWLKESLGDRVVERVVVTTGEFAYRRRDGVVVVPLALLGP
ncbi:ATP-binding protein [Agromyces archimandritae]|uniref:ATP-binding protein n=1 Tax=Agromyces archimandritae TaxID=2781962 RepID=A0A975FPP3_9MICO|nr:DUF4143 domain-containing protein [Agromyces archimandritae]QTX05742.1 ATP-binding protein [Agromyces archimandritae]